ncbi:MAG: hypothetical protein JSW28_01120 [Thermoplasmata archaeon]|nr:MAG: hypothetical protein JSW28_01120 [Thermoplasmata archaeon]
MVVVNLAGPLRKRDKYSTPEISEAKQIRDAAQTEHKIAKLREKAATRRSKSAHLKEKAALYRKKAAKAREMSLIYQEEAEQLEKQAQDLERTLRPIYPDEGGRGYDRDDRGGYRSGKRDDRPRGY